jgi:two-component system NarL family sensor kinase
MAYLTVAFTHPATSRQPFAVTITQGMYIIWVGIAAVVLATLLSRRRHKILELSQARGRLVAQALDAEELARKRVSEALHDHAIQDLLTARQDLAEARSGHAGALDRAELAVRQALEQLRSTVSDLHPYLLDHLDLRAALEAIAAQQAARGGYQAVIDTDPAALGTHDQLIASLARELLSNAAQHANPSRVTLQLTRRNGSVILAVADDGCGFTSEQQTAALRTGHIGLAASRERVEASAGSFQISSHPGHGTQVRCTLPVDAHSISAQNHSATHTSLTPQQALRAQ